METKCFELRDEGTTVPVIATLMDEPANEEERWLLRRAGYGIGTGLVLMDRMDGGRSSYDWHAHGGGPRTWPIAHQYIQEHWGELVSGQVVDVRTILGETSEPCRSDRFNEREVASDG